MKYIFFMLVSGFIRTITLLIFKYVVVFVVQSLHLHL
jgi:hypothetical protein